jgi:hypothetical protein
VKTFSITEKSSGKSPGEFAGSWERRDPLIRFGRAGLYFTPNPVTNAQIWRADKLDSGVFKRLPNLLHGIEVGFDGSFRAFQPAYRRKRQSRLAGEFILPPSQERAGRLDLSRVNQHGHSRSPAWLSTRRAQQISPRMPTGIPTSSPSQRRSVQHASSQPNDRFTFEVTRQMPQRKYSQVTVILPPDGAGLPGRANHAAIMIVTAELQPCGISGCVFMHDCQFTPTHARPRC